VAEVVGGVGTSHVPNIGAAMDRGITDTEPWRQIFAGYEPARAWVADQRPDVAIVIYNDHGSAFSLDMLPTFAIGVADSYPVADEGYGARPVPQIHGDPDLAWHLVESVQADDFDLTVCQRLPVDHGLTVPLSILFGAPQQWPVRVIPIALNVIQYPLPTPARCFALGRAIRRALDSYSPDVRVLVVGTGGMSHQLQGTRVGHINQEFDRMFLEKIRSDPAALTSLTIPDYIREAGSEGAELIMWLVMRGALSPEVSFVHSDYHVPASNTAEGIVVMAEAAGARTSAGVPAVAESTA
jgi:protocatechuate 4,5-dioxygenase beta chain